jgi:hypothetical protein
MFGIKAFLGHLGFCFSMRLMLVIPQNGSAKGAREVSDRSGLLWLDA